MANPPSNESVTSFPVLLSIDSCAIWNILCSKTLTVAAKLQNRHFVLSEYVRYECLVRPRKNPSSIEIDLQKKLENELKIERHFSVHSLDIDSLRDLVASLGKIQHFHRGELATLALARKLGNGFLTDDYMARLTAQNVLGNSRVRTTPHLVGWLVYKDQLIDSDIQKIIDDNKLFRRKKGFLGEFIDASYKHALIMKRNRIMGAENND